MVCVSFLIMFIIFILICHFAWLFSEELLTYCRRINIVVLHLNTLSAQSQHFSRLADVITAVKKLHDEWTILRDHLVLYLGHPDIAVLGSVRPLTTDHIDWLLLHSPTGSNKKLLPLLKTYERQKERFFSIDELLVAVHASLPAGNPQVTLALNKQNGSALNRVSVDSTSSSFSSTNNSANTSTQEVAQSATGSVNANVPAPVAELIHLDCVTAGRSQV